MRYVAFVLIAFAFVGILYISQRASQAVTHRDAQPADSNDVVLVVAMVGTAIILALGAVVFAVLA